MMLMNIREIETAFANAIADVGMVVNDPIIADGKLHRVHVEGDNRGSKNGAYILHADHHPAGWYQHFRTSMTGRWTASGKCVPMSLDMRMQIEAERKMRQAEQLKCQLAAASKAAFIWRKAKSLVEQCQHPYLVKKNIQPHRVRMYRDSLVIGIYDQDKQLVNLQFIDSAGNKRFLSGGKKKSCFSFVGDKVSQTLLICEGYATGASLYQVTGLFTIVALDAGNLEAVALTIRKLYPSHSIIIAGDNDESGTGQKAARSAALAVGGKYILPVRTGYDWNDAINDREAV